MYLPRRRALSSTASKTLTLTAFVLLTNFNIILALIFASLLTSKLFSDFYQLFHLIVSSFQGNESFAFCSVD